MTPPFDLGTVRVTAAARHACSRDRLFACLDRHRLGDWGCLCPDDAADNLRALLEDRRVLSAHPLDPAKPCKGYGPNTLWIITEPHPRATTILLPDDLLHPTALSVSSPLDSALLDGLLGSS
jgi:hypothetical protein